MKTQSRTTKALQSLSLFKIKGREKQQKKTWAQDWSIFSSEQKSNKLGRNREKDKRWPSVGLLPTLGQDGTLGSQTTQQGLSLRVSNSGDKQELREAATCLLRPRGLGGAHQRSWNSVTLKPSVLTLTHSQFPLLFFKLWDFFSSLQKT